MVSDFSRREIFHVVLPEPCLDCFCFARMNLCYCAGLANFGDDLNPWLWNRLIPGHLDEDRSTLFLGIGTLLNQKVPKNPLKIVFGSGTGYGPAPVPDEKWRFYCVRGPLSAQALGLAPELAITDPAALIRTMVFPRLHGIYNASFMPHYLSARYADWEAVCRAAGIHYIDPGAPVLQVLQQIQSSKLVISESLHGAIVADALRVPWIAVQAYHHINRFKWQDWCLSLGLTDTPAALTPLWDVERYGNAPLKLKLKLKSGLHALGVRWKRWSPVRPLVSPQADIESATRQLDTLARKTSPLLSRDCDLERAVSRLQEKLTLFKEECASANPASSPETLLPADPAVAGT